MFTDIVKMSNDTTPFVYQFVSREEYFSVNLFSTIVGTLGMCANLFILFIFAKYRSLRRGNSLCVFALLAICDFFAAFGQVEFSATHLVRQIRDAPETTVYYCLLWSSAPTFGVQMSQIGLITVAWDRLAAFHSPIAYRTRNHVRVCCIVLLLAVPYCLLTTALLFAFVDLNGSPKMCNASDSSPFFVVYWTIMSWVVSVTVLALFCRAFILMRRILSTNDLPSLTRLLALQQSKMTFTIQMILFVFIFAWVFPNCLVIIAYTLDRAEMLGRIVRVIGTGSGISSVVNVFIFSFRKGPIRKHVMKFFHATTCCYPCARVNRIVPVVNHIRFAQRFIHPQIEIKVISASGQRKSITL